MRCGIALLDAELYVQGGKFGLQINFICDGSKAAKNVTRPLTYDHENKTSHPHHLSTYCKSN